MFSFPSLQLEKSRKQKAVSLEQIADVTKISTRFLRAIESEEFEKLPGGVFDTNYIRQYAAAIAVPEELILAQYAEFLRTKENGQMSQDGRATSGRRRWLSWLRSPSPAARS